MRITKKGKFHEMHLTTLVNLLIACCRRLVMIHLLLFALDCNPVTRCQLLSFLTTFLNSINQIHPPSILFHGFRPTALPTHVASFTTSLSYNSILFRPLSPHSPQPTTFQKHISIFSCNTVRLQVFSIGFN